MIRGKKKLGTLQKIGNVSERWTTVSTNKTHKCRLSLSYQWSPVLSKGETPFAINIYVPNKYTDGGNISLSVTGQCLSLNKLDFMWTYDSESGPPLNSTVCFDFYARVYNDWGKKANQPVGSVIVPLSDIFMAMKRYGQMKTSYGQLPSIDLEYTSVVIRDQWFPKGTLKVYVTEKSFSVNGNTQLTVNNFEIPMLQTLVYSNVFRDSEGQVFYRSMYNEETGTEIDLEMESFQGIYEESTRIIERSDANVSELEPTIEYLRDIKLDYFLGQVFLPGVAYTMHHPLVPTEERWFLGMLKIVLRRHQYRYKDVLEIAETLVVNENDLSPQMVQKIFTISVVLSELFTTFVNTMPYLDDYNNRNGSVRSIEKLEWARVQYSGDCEDSGTEIVICAWEFERTTLMNPLLKYLRYILKNYYLPVITLSAVSAQSMAREHLKQENFGAHIHALFLPLLLVVEALERDGHNRSVHRVLMKKNDLARNVHTLLGEGTALVEGDTTGKLSIIHNVKEAEKLKKNEMERAQVTSELERGYERVFDLMKRETFMDVIDGVKSEHAFYKYTTRVLTGVFNERYGNGVFEMALLKKHRRGDLTVGISYPMLAGDRNNILMRPTYKLKEPEIQWIKGTLNSTQIPLPGIVPHYRTKEEQVKFRGSLTSGDLINLAFLDQVSMVQVSFDIKSAFEKLTRMYKKPKDISQYFRVWYTVSKQDINLAWLNEMYEVLSSKRKLGRPVVWIEVFEEFISWGRENYLIVIYFS